MTVLFPLLLVNRKNLESLMLYKQLRTLWVATSYFFSMVVPRFVFSSSQLDPMLEVKAFVPKKERSLSDKGYLTIEIFRYIIQEFKKIGGHCSKRIDVVISVSSISCLVLLIGFRYMIKNPFAILKNQLAAKKKKKKSIHDFPRFNQKRLLTLRWQRYTKRNQVHSSHQQFLTRSDKCDCDLAIQTRSEIYVRYIVLLFLSSIQLNA